MNKPILFVLWGTLAAALVGVGVAQFVLPRHRAVSAEVPQAQNASAHAPRGRELFPAAQFALTDQEGRTIRSEDLHGSPWIADFIFTRCGGTCPLMSHKMTELQRQTPAGVKLISFTVDPAFDTPEVLKAYAKPLKANPGRWHFLTGTVKQIGDAEYGMKISVAPGDKTQPIVHSTRFVLVNGRGMVVGIYDSTSEADMKALVADATKLAGEKGA